MRRSRVPRLPLYTFLLLDQLFLPNVHREKAVFSLLKRERGNPRILDAGCGLAYMSFKLIRQGYEVYSGDVNDGFRRTLACLPQEYRKRMNLIRFDLRHLPFRESSFDVAICVDVMEHVEDHEEAMSELRGALRARGKLILHVPSIEGLGEDWTHGLVQPGSLTEKFRGHARHGYTVQTLGEELAAAGFSDAVFFHTFNRTIQRMNRLEKVVALRVTMHLLFRQVARFEGPLESKKRYSRRDFEGLMVEAARPGA